MDFRSGSEEATLLTAPWLFRNPVYKLISKAMSLAHTQIYAVRAKIEFGFTYLPTGQNQIEASHHKEAFGIIMHAAYLYNVSSP